MSNENAPELNAEDLVDAALCWLHDDSLEYFLETHGWTDEQQAAWESEYKERVRSFAQRVQGMIELAAREAMTP